MAEYGSEAPVSGPVSDLPPLSDVLCSVGGALDAQPIPVCLQRRQTIILGLDVCCVNDNCPMHQAAVEFRRFAKERLARPDSNPVAPSSARCPSRHHIATTAVDTALFRSEAFWRDLLSYLTSCTGCPGRSDQVDSGR